MSRSAVSVLVAICLLAGGCQAGSSAPPDARAPAVDGGVDQAGPDGDGPPSPGAECNPLAADPEHCLLPWPSSFYLRSDETTETGLRVAYPREAMPVNGAGVRVDPTPWNRLDGFSPGSQPIVAFPGGVTAEGLPPSSDIAASLSDDCLVAIIELDTGARVPLFAEVDANATADTAALILRPMRPLRFDTRHAVVLREGLKDGAGKPLAAPAAFARVLAGLPIDDDPRLAAEATRLEPVLDALRGHGVDLARVLLAWDFHTASEKAVTGPLIGIVDDALARLGDKLPAIEDVVSEDLDASQSTQIARTVRGKMVVPSYLASDDPEAWLARDDAGRPRYRGEQRFEFHLHIPRCALQASAPLPLLIFGHGLFGDPSEMLQSSLHRGLAQRLCVVEVAARWLGLSLRDVPGVTGVAQDFSSLPRVTDHLLQGQVNAQVLVRLVKGALRDHPAMQLHGKPVIDGAELYYLGISLGGIQGVTFAALSKEIERHALHVGAGYWSMMMERSSNFAPLALVFSGAYRRATDRLLLLAMSQSLWDGSDPINFARYVRQSPLPGRVKKRVAFTESRHDDQVPNLASRVVVRALGLPLMTPRVEPVFGVPEQAGPLEAAYVQWDVQPPAIPPDENIPAERPDPEVSAHFVVRYLESFAAQLELFFRPDGLVEHTCSGPCGVE